MVNCSEAFRSELISAISPHIKPDMLGVACKTLDVIMSHYDITSVFMPEYNEDGVPSIVQEFLSSKSLENKSENTLKLYQTLLCLFFSSVQKTYDNITTTDIRAFLSSYKEEHHISDSTLDLHRRVLQSFFAWCKENEYILRNPADRISKIKYQASEREPLSAYNLEIIRWNCKTLRERAEIDFLFSTGCRASECVNVKLDDINWDEHSVIIRHGKGDKRRIVFFNAEAMVSMQQYLKSRDDKSPYLFVSSKRPYQQISIRALERDIRILKERSGIDQKFVPHTLRHTFATTSIRAGMPLERLQALMGHSKPDTTLIYAKLDDEDLKRAHERIFQ